MGHDHESRELRDTHRGEVQILWLIDNYLLVRHASDHAYILEQHDKRVQYVRIRIWLAVLKDTLYNFFKGRGSN